MKSHRVTLWKIIILTNKISSIIPFLRFFLPFNWAKAPGIENCEQWALVLQKILKTSKFATTYCFYRNMSPYAQSSIHVIINTYCMYWLMYSIPDNIAVSSLSAERNSSFSFFFFLFFCHHFKWPSLNENNKCIALIKAYYEQKGQEKKCAQASIQVEKEKYREKKYGQI